MHQSMNKIFIVVLALLPAVPLRGAEVGMKILSPSDGAAIDSPLSATLSWTYPAINELFRPVSKVRVEVSLHEDLSQPIVAIELPENQTSYRLAVAPQKTYFWRVTPIDGNGPRTNHAIHAHFKTGAPQINATDDDPALSENSALTGMH
jgi:hypothetical protein